MLLETLTQTTAFAGETSSDTIVRVLEREPNWQLLPDTAPPSIRKLIRRCLEKDLHRRLRDIGDARLEIEDALAGHEPDAEPSASSRLRSPHVRWAIAGALTHRRLSRSNRSKRSSRFLPRDAGE